MEYKYFCIYLNIVSGHPMGGITGVAAHECGDKILSSQTLIGLIYEPWSISTTSPKGSKSIESNDTKYTCAGKSNFSAFQ